MHLPSPVQLITKRGGERWLVTALTKVKDKNEERRKGWGEKTKVGEKKRGKKKK